MILGIIILVVLFVAYALLCAITEAHYQDYLYFTDRKHKNLHPLYFIERGIVLFFVWLQTYNLFIWDRIIFCFALILIHPFFHNGMLYTVRNYLTPEIYKKKWFADKEKGQDKHSAIFEISAKFRIAMLLIGLLLITGVILESV